MQIVFCCVAILSNKTAEISFYGFSGEEIRLHVVE